MHIFFIPDWGEGGYQVRVGRGGPGQTKFFAVRKHGGHRKAMAAAKKYALELVQRHPTRSRLGVLNSNNKSGVSGIRVEWRVSARSEFAYPYVTGHWLDGVNPHHRSFAYSIDKHGLEGAVRLAYQRRKVGGVPLPPLEEAVRRLREAYPELGLR